MCLSHHSPHSALLLLLSPQVINGLMMKMDYDGADGPITISYNHYDGKSKVGKPSSLEVDMVIGADGANSRVAKDIGAGEYDYAIAFQERIKIPDDKMDYYSNLAEMYVGDDVSPDFYGKWGSLSLPVEDCSILNLLWLFRERSDGRAQVFNN